LACCTVSRQFYGADLMHDSNPHWSRRGESGTVLGMKFMLLIFRIFGPRGFRLLLYPVIVYYYLFQPKARAASKQYLQQISHFLPEDKRAGLSSFRHFVMFGEILVDKLLAWMGKILSDDVEFETPDILSKMNTERKGGIIVVSHLGNFEVCSALANQLPNLKLTILIYTQHAEKFNRLMKRVSGNTEVEIMQVTDISPVTAMKLSERIKAGGYVVVAGDRTPVTGQKRVSRVRFLGQIAPMPQGAFVLAGLLKCPVYLMFCLKQLDRYHIYVEHFARKLDFSDRKKRLNTLDEAVQKFALRLEFYCLKAPLQWFNFFHYWDSEAPSENNPAPGCEKNFRK